MTQRFVVIVEFDNTDPVAYEFTPTAEDPWGEGPRAAVRKLYESSKHVTDVSVTQLKPIPRS